MQLPKKKSTLVIAINGILLGLIRIMNILVFSHIRTKKGKLVSLFIMQNMDLLRPGRRPRATGSLYEHRLQPPIHASL